MEVEEVLDELCGRSIAVTYLYNAVDACGNSSTAMQFIVVIDDQAPTFEECPEFISIESQENPVPMQFLGDSQSLGIEDNCDSDIAVSPSIAIGPLLAPGT